MSTPRLLLLTALALLAFAGNSLLCRLALRDGGIDPASFTSLRLLSGALALAALVALRKRPLPGARGDWSSALALFTYAAVKVWADAANKAKSTEAAKVAAALRTGTYDSAVGPLT